VSFEVSPSNFRYRLYISTKICIILPTSKREPLSQWQIKNIHRIILKGITDNYAGLYGDQYPPIVIEVNNHLAYYNALDKSIARDDYTDLNNLISQAIEKLLNLYLSIL
jgi:hypothetical protein